MRLGSELKCFSAQLKVICLCSSTPLGQTFCTLTHTFIMKNATANSSAFHMHVWAAECPTTVMSKCWFMTFLTLPGCLLPAYQPLVSLISFDGTSRGKIRQESIEELKYWDTTKIEAIHFFRLEGIILPRHNWQEKNKTKKIQSIFRYQRLLDSSACFLCVCVTSSWTDGCDGARVKTRRNHIDFSFLFF